MSTTITHLGNDGILLDDGSHRVIIDGLYRGMLSLWSKLPEDKQTLLEEAKPPFNNIDVSLITHVHPDHYHAESVGLHLEHNPTMKIVAPEQVVADMQEKFANFSDVQSQLADINLKWYETTTETINGVPITVLGMHHFNMFEHNFSGIQNYGYIIHMDGKNFLHLGDVDMSVDNLEKFDFHTIDIDYVFLPMFSKNLSPERKDIVQKIINPKHVIALHVMQGTEEETVNEVKALYPEANTFTEVLESIEV